MYDLAGAEDARRISPFCWRVRMALAHKGLSVETRPCRLVEKDVIRRSGVTTLPVIADGDSMIGNSWAIAEYLDQTWPDRPLLFANAQARVLTRFVHHWTERVLHHLLVPLILRDVVAHLHQMDRAFFRETREKAFGKPLEAVMDDRPAAFARVAAALAPLRSTLRETPFLAGAKPEFSDYIVFGLFQWARSCSPLMLVRGTDDPILGWLSRMAELHGGLADNAPGYVSWRRPADGSPHERSVRP